MEINSSPYNTKVLSFSIDENGLCKIKIWTKEGIFELSKKFQLPSNSMTLNICEDMAKDMYDFFHIRQTSFTIDSLFSDAHIEWEVQCIESFTPQLTKIKVKPNGAHKHRTNKKRG